MMSALVGAMFWARQSAISQGSSLTSVPDWKKTRDEMREEQSRHGPVERRLPKSEEPPALVLMRDYFVILMMGALLFSSLLYWIIAWFVTGILKSG